MSSHHEDYFWSHTEYPEGFYVFSAYSMFKNMVFRYLLPIVQHLLPIKNAGYMRKLQRLKFETNRKYIATHIKSVYEKVKVFVVNDVQLCDELVQKRMIGESCVHFIGLDCEWDSAKKNGVALVQISCGNDCLLYQLATANGGMPDSLKKLLEDRKILKFGVAIQEDVRRLRYHGVNVKGYVDLRNLAQRCLPARDDMAIHENSEDPYQWTSLRSLAANAINVKLNKNYHIRCGDWEATSLSKQQVLYAAKDAIVSLEIFYALILLRKVTRQNVSVLPDSFETKSEIVTKWVNGNTWEDFILNLYCYCHTSDQLTELDPTLPTSYHLTKPSDWLKELAYSLCQGIVDTNHKYKPPASMKVGNIRNVSSRAMSTKTDCQKVYKHQCRGKPLYENCFLLGPDKKVLATVNESKARWYVRKGLGQIDCESPFTVRLLFEPSGRPMPDADYYTTVKENVCVVCGSTESFVRKMIIPHDYRKYFPQNFKDHMSHDVLLMCLDCHRMAQYSDEQMRQELADKYNAPLGTKERMMFIDNPGLVTVRSAAKALLHSGSKIPEKRRKQLEDIVKNHTGEDIISEDILKKMVSINIKTENREFQGLHGERVVRSVIADGKLAEFVRMWREHFLDYMQPKFLPVMWSIEHNLHKVESMLDSNVSDESSK